MDFTALKDFMNRLTAWRMPGNTVSVYLKGKEVFRYSSGYANLEEKIPMTGDELLNIYSCSKVATITAALQLYEKGFFLLDDPLYDFLPEFRHMCVKNVDGTLREAKNPVTMRHLFTMTSGITYNTQSSAFDKARELTGGKMDTLTLVRCLAEVPLTFDPGDDWQYGLNHDILAGVVELISGKRFSQYVQDNIFGPLNMQDATYHNDLVMDKMAEQYQFVNSTETDLVKLQMSADIRQDGYLENIGKKNILDFGENYDSGGAGITISVPEYAKFGDAMANGGVGATGERIIAPQTVELLRTNQLSARQRETFSQGKFRGYGYGLGVRTMMERGESGSLSSVGEFGWGGAAGGNLIVDPALGISAFYAHHMLNPAEEYYQPRLINTLYSCL